MPLLESVLGHLDVPVLAAGGIGDGRAFAAVLDKGAAGARAGTRFVATDESGAHPAYKQAVADAVADATEITDAGAGWCTEHSLRRLTVSPSQFFSMWVVPSARVDIRPSTYVEWLPHGIAVAVWG